MTHTSVTLVILGATGDLTTRLLLPGLGTLLRNRRAYDVRLIGASNEEISQDEWKARVSEALAEGGCPQDELSPLLAATHFEVLDVTDQEALGGFLGRVDEPGRPTILYFALPPAVTERACEAMRGIELPEGLRLALEKPFGSSHESAAALNALLTTLVPEEQIFRVDHFLGKATVLNLLGLRFGNRVFEPVWNAANIASVDIVVDEQLALEGRAGYYDHAGALVDMIQSHLLLVLAILAMEAPARIDELEVRDLMAHTLRQVRLWDDDPATSSRRARYTAGSVEGREIPSYVDEEGVDPANETETLAELDVEVRTARWAGVRFRMRSGKALGGGLRASIIHFKDAPYLPEGFEGGAPSNMLVLGMAPETIQLVVATNGGGNAWNFEMTPLGASLGESMLRPYGEILEGIITGDPLLSVRGDVAEECWRIVEPVLAAWKAGKVPLEEYEAGSEGPIAWG
ncbi:MAG: glucose-6-phosphate dehydrogenase [bacterium]|nr:glucose-6-phosphate dehydrogenase [bacterium]